MAFSCSASGLDCCYVGEEGPVYAATARLENALIACQAGGDMTRAACFIRDEMLQKMAELRVACDEAETLTAEKYWPFPTYDKLLFSVK